MTLIFSNGSKQPTDRVCKTPAPDIFSCPLPQPCEEEQCCDPKTHLKNAIKIKRNETERKLYLIENGCSYNQLPILMKCIKMVIRKRGFCRPILELEPYKLDIDGGVYFSWGKHFLSLCEGLYEADVFIDCKLVNTLLFYKKEQLGTVVTEPVIYDPCSGGEVPCDSSCGNSCSSCGSIPTIDIEYDNTPKPNCGDCDAGCN